ncbi:hypothetical protein QJS10_CPA01g01196 [Acorus calamus]|uniref:Uncharacterized protein n=1 Tax=Acorus calamus TaxID=4465 RepID=A0AAV9FH78_ACOCL|nr:hypothetical protein QJS10_CPA01g01196 [Acorus calamus]
MDESNSQGQSLCFFLEVSWTSIVGCSLSKQRRRAVLETVSQRLQGWKGQLLSMAGRCVLIQSVINAMPQHFMLSAALSVGVANEVEKAARSFLWNGSSLAPKIHLICWESVTRDKKEGGLGIRRLTGLREAILGIIAFKFLLSPSMLSSMYALKYKWNGNPWELVEPRTASPVWKSLCFGLRLIRPYVRKLPATGLRCYNSQGG